MDAADARRFGCEAMSRGGEIDEDNAWVSAEFELRRQVTILVKALKPFADVTGYACIKDEAVVGIDFTRRIPKSRREYLLTAGDFRRARAALAATELKEPK